MGAKQLKFIEKSSQSSIQIQNRLVYLYYNNKGNNILNSSKMEKTVFYVAVAYSLEAFNPTVVEKFNNRADADSYAALLSRTKQCKYIVLEQVTEWDGTTQEK